MNVGRCQSCLSGKSRPPWFLLIQHYLRPLDPSPPLIPSRGSVSRDQERGALLDPFELIKASFHLATEARPGSEPRETGDGY